MGGWQKQLFADFEHGRAAIWTLTLHGRFAIFHCHSLEFVSFFFGATFNAIEASHQLSHLLSWNKPTLALSIARLRG